MQAIEVIEAIETVQTFETSEAIDAIEALRGNAPDEGVRDAGGDVCQQHRIVVGLLWWWLDALPEHRSGPNTAPSPNPNPYEALMRCRSTGIAPASTTSIRCSHPRQERVGRRGVGIGLGMDTCPSNAARLLKIPPAISCIDTGPVASSETIVDKMPHCSASQDHA